MYVCNDNENKKSNTSNNDDNKSFSNDDCRSNHPEVFLKKRCSENMQQIYMRTSIPKCDFNKVAKQLY